MSKGQGLRTKGEGPMTDFVRGLKCRLCGKTYGKEPLNFCTEDFGPLEVDYDYDGIKEVLSRDKLALRLNNMWRFHELLPLDGEPTVGLHVGGVSGGRQGRRRRRAGQRPRRADGRAAGAHGEGTSGGGLSRPRAYRVGRRLAAVLRRRRR